MYFCFKIGLHILSSQEANSVYNKDVSDNDEGGDDNDDNDDDDGDGDDND